MKIKQDKITFLFKLFLLITIFSVNVEASSRMKKLIPYNSNYIKAEQLVQTNAPTIRPDLKSIKSTGNKVPSAVKPVKKKKIVFIGNSKTFYPETLAAGIGIPARLNSMLLDKDKKYSFSQILTGGYSLENHYLKDLKDIDKSYDVAFLQEKSDISVYNYSNYLSSAINIASTLRANNPNVKIYLRVLLPFTTISEEERNLAYRNGKKIANKLGATPVYEGLYYEEYMKEHPGETLILDNRHQNSNGAYISALCLYKALTNKAYIGSIHSDLPKKTAKLLQEYVASKNYSL